MDRRDGGEEHFPCTVFKNNQEDALLASIIDLQQDLVKRAEEGLYQEMVKLIV